MASNQELADTVKELRGRIKELEAENETLKKGSGNISGWLIKTPTPFNGVTLGVVFRGGMAFMLDGDTPEERKENERKAKELHDDFGYLVEHVDNLKSLPTEANSAGKTLVDYLFK